MVFWPIFDPKIGFLRFYPGKLRVITLKPLLIDSTVKNTSRKVYLESLAYRAENARKSFYYIGHFTPTVPFPTSNPGKKTTYWSKKMERVCNMNRLVDFEF